MEQALVHYRQAIVIDPFFADAHSAWRACNWLIALAWAAPCRITHPTTDKSFLISIHRQPPTGNLGNLLKDLRCLDHAIHCYITAIQIRPSFADGASTFWSLALVRPHLLFC